ncbi:phosphoribosylaminoimidazolecarboxamide formyltransferase/IMP cyclohydrolase [Microbacterium testaceum]|nr:phosphoribosylaminoimidazolecarboxamide formyltransferase/IMP cyclohydrolase [Microbacterium testaceum]
MAGPRHDPADYRPRDIVPIRRALVSVSDKTGLLQLGEALAAAGVEIVSTGGSATLLRDAGLEVTDVSAVTGFPESLDGRVKTLHPNVHAGLLADLRLASHEAQLDELGIRPFELVVVNLYPFVETVASGAEGDDVVEQIDIGGPAMVRASAKNHANVAIVVSPESYPAIIDAVQTQGGTTLVQRRELAARAFSHTRRLRHRRVDLVRRGHSRRRHRPARAPHHPGRAPVDPALRRELAPARRDLHARRRARHRPGHAAAGQGDVVQQLRRRRRRPARRVRHGQARRGDHQAREPLRHRGRRPQRARPDRLGAPARARVRPRVGLRRSDRREPHRDAQDGREPARHLHRGHHRARLRARSARGVFKLKKNLRVLRLPADWTQESMDVRLVSGGLLLQDADRFPDDIESVAKNWELVSGERPAEADMESLIFAWKSCRAVKSNAIVLAQASATVGIGMGQVNRVDSCRLAVERAGDRAAGSVAASDAFFPFADGPQVLIDAGISAIIQPGGSVRDAEVVDAARAAGVTMFFTGERHFFH